MIIFSENFKSCKDGKQPYSIMPEITHKYSGYDAEVKNQTFYIKRRHTKQFLLMPEVTDFRLSLDFSFSVPGKGENNSEPIWCIFLGYDRITRSGYQLSFRYKKADCIMEITLLKINGVKRNEINRHIMRNVCIHQEQYAAVSVICEYGELEISLQNQTVLFDIEPEKGIIALSAEGHGCETGFANINIYGNRFEKEQIWKENFKIPRTDGGVLDYYLTLSIDKINEELFEINYELNGGAYENHTEFKGADCWVWEYDTFSGLYFLFGAEKYYLTDDRLVFVDNDYKDLKRLLGGSDIPFCGSFRVCGSMNFTNVFIGYDRRFSLCAGNLVSDRMFTYDKHGTLLFIGKALTENCFFDVRSNPSKEIAKRIPETNADYEDALFHAQNNHYFIKEETPQFGIDLYSKEDIRYLHFYAELQNTWFEKIEECSVEGIEEEDSIFPGYRKYHFSVKCDVHAQGVYHIKITCRCGSGELYEHTSAFEIIDDALAESPQETAGLPNIYCGDGFPTKYSTYDMASVDRILT